MGKTWAAALVALAGIACGGGAIRVEVRPAVIADSAPKVAPAAAVLRAAPAKEAWIVEIVGTADVLRNVALSVGPHGTSIVYAAPAARRIERVRRGVKGWWSPEHLVDGGSARVTFDRHNLGPSWMLLGDEPVLGEVVAGGPPSLWAERLTPGSRPERVIRGSARAYALALAPDGTPHACVSTSKSPDLVHATRGTQGWSTTTIGKESERCAIAAGDDGSLIVASANVAAVDVAVRSRTRIWRRAALEAGEHFAAVDVAIQGKNSVIAFSNDRRLKLARLQVDGTWTKSVIVADAGGLIGAVAVALDSAGTARIAFTVRREKESSDEVMFVSEATKAPSTVAVNDSWRFTSLSLAIDDQDHPHVAFTGAAGRLFYAAPD